MKINHLALGLLLHLFNYLFPGNQRPCREGFNLQTGYLLKSNYEVSGRFTNIILDRDITGIHPEKQYPLGLLKYIVGHKLKVQADLSYLSDDNGVNEPRVRLQLDVHL